jgi:hypothetical protein
LTPKARRKKTEPRLCYRPSTLSRLMGQRTRGCISLTRAQERPQLIGFGWEPRRDEAGRKSTRHQITVSLTSTPRRPRAASASRLRFSSVGTIEGAREACTLTPDPRKPGTDSFRNRPLELGTPIILNSHHLKQRLAGDVVVSSLLLAPPRTTTGIRHDLCSSARRSNCSPTRWTSHRCRRLPACQTILNAIGNLLADLCQVEEFLFAEDIFGFFGKRSMFGYRPRTSRTLTMLNLALSSVF